MSERTPLWPETPLHKVTAGLLARARATGAKPLGAGTPDDARATFAAARAIIGDGDSVRETRTVEIPTRAGSIPALACIPEGEIVGLCVYLHGGGWVVGALPDCAPLARTIAARSRCTVLVPDYRLAPEHKFPAGLDDCEDAVRWAFAHRATLARPEAPLCLVGDSAGGNLATVTAARVAGDVALAGQVLVYPVVDADFETDSYHQYAAGLPLCRTDMIWFFEHYAPKSEWRNPEIVPLRAPSVAPLPRTAILLAEHDVLRDEGEAYARKLFPAARLHEVHRYPGVAHGFLRYHALIDTADQAVTDLSHLLQTFCTTPTHPPAP